MSVPARPGRLVPVDPGQPVWGLEAESDPAPGAHGRRGALGPIAFSGPRDYQVCFLEFYRGNRGSERVDATFPRAPDHCPTPETPSRYVKPQAGNALCVPCLNPKQQGARVSGVPAPEPCPLSRTPWRPGPRISMKHVGPIPPLYPELTALPTWKQQLPESSLECSTPGIITACWTEKVQREESMKGSSLRAPRRGFRGPALGFQGLGKTYLVEFISPAVQRRQSAAASARG